MARGKSIHGTDRFACLALLGLWAGAWAGLATEPAGETDHVFHSWQRQHGLPENMVKVLCQTRDGYLWIGTYSGLARFDGLKFTAFDHNSLPGLPSDVCKALAEDREGNLWIGTDRGLVCWNDRGLEVFTTRHGLSSDDIRLLCVGQQDRLWIATEAGLDRFSAGTFTRLTAQEGLRLNFVSSMYEDPSGALWITTTRGVQRWNPAAERFEDCVNYEVDETGGFTAGRWSNCHVTGQRDTLWCGQVLRSGGAFAGLMLLNCDAELAGARAELMGASPSRLFYHTNETSSASDDLAAMTLGRSADAWLATARGGLLRFRDGTFRRYGKMQGLSDDSLLSLLVDREGNLWIGTRNGGLNRCQPLPFQVYHADDGLPHNKAWTICEGREGSIWIGTDGGVSRWQQGRLTNYTAAEGLTNTMVRSLHEDANGILWIGTGDGLFCLRDGNLTPQPLVPGFEKQKLRVVTSDRAGTLWVGWEHGLLQFRDCQWSNFTTQAGLPSNDVRAVLETRDGALWLGTFGGGLARWHTGTMRCFTTKDGLASDFAWTLHEDAEGVLWVGTEGGLTRHENGRLTSYTTREGLFDNLINQILEDDHGWLWLSCDRGIFRVRKRELNDFANGRTRTIHSIAYSEADGLLSAETNGRKSQPAGCKTRDGRLWFATAKGVAVIDPRALTYEETPPPVVIEELHSNGRRTFGNVPGPQSLLAPSERNDRESADVAAPVSAEARITDLKSEIRIPPDGGRLLTVHYTANSLAAPERVRFKYRLLGSHAEWIEAGTRRVAYYTNLRPGRYRFQVIACNHHGVWNETGASLAFYLAPYFHQTWWFYAACAAGIAVLAGALLRWRLGQHRRIQALEAHARMSRELARISSDLHDSLGGTLTNHTHLLTRTRREAEQPGALRKHLDSLEHSTRDALQSLKEIIWATNPRCDSLEHLVTYICEYAARALEPAGIRCRFDVPVSLPEHQLPAALRHHVFLTAKEALHNIVRHAGATEVWIRASVQSSTLRLALEDNGRGFDLQHPTATPQPGDGGNGLPNMKQRMNDCGGRLTLTSAPGQGTKIEIEVPLSEPAPRP